jgi:hypothetical protein
MGGGGQSTRATPVSASTASSPTLLRTGRPSGLRHHLCGSWFLASQFLVRAASEFGNAQGGVGDCFPHQFHALPKASRTHARYQARLRRHERENESTFAIGLRRLDGHFSDWLVFPLRHGPNRCAGEASVVVHLSIAAQGCQPDTELLTVRTQAGLGGHRNLLPWERTTTGSGASAETHSGRRIRKTSLSSHRLLNAAAFMGSGLNFVLRSGPYLGAR